MEKLLTVAQAAQVLKVSRGVVRGLVKRGRLKAVNVGLSGKLYARISSSELERFARGGVPE